MALTASQRLGVIAPQFDSVANRDAFLEMATERTSPSTFASPKFEQAVALRAAHMLQLSTTRPLGEAGTVASKSEGQLAVSFGGASVSSDKWADLGQTHFGIQLLALIKGTVITMGVCSGTPPGAAESDW